MGPVSGGWQEHRIRQGDGKGGWILKPAQKQVLLAVSSYGLVPAAGAEVAYSGAGGYSLAQMDNGEIVCLGAGGQAAGGQQITVATFSRDRGETWTDPRPISDPPAIGRPVLLAYLGKGNLTFRSQQPALRFFSSDYGRTWSAPKDVQPATDGCEVYGEGNPLVDLGADGNAVRVAEVNWYCESGSWKPTIPSIGIIRSSTDGCRTWTTETRPTAWRVTVEHDGKPCIRGTDEGSLVRAANGWIVASLRTNMLPQYFELHNDQMEGTAVSISKDDGKTWSPRKDVAEAGRMHSCLLRMPNDDLVMTMIVRHDIKRGELVSNRRGCDALISHDNGLTWNPDRSYKLDEFDYQDAETTYPNVCGHVASIPLDDGSILTTYDNYVRGLTLIRWRP